MNTTMVPGYEVVDGIMIRVCGECGGRGRVLIGEHEDCRGCGECMRDCYACDRDGWVPVYCGWCGADACGWTHGQPACVECRANILDRGMWDAELVATAELPAVEAAPVMAPMAESITDRFVEIQFSDNWTDGHTTVEQPVIDTEEAYNNLLAGCRS